MEGREQSLVQWVQSGCQGVSTSPSVSPDRPLSLSVKQVLEQLQACFGSGQLKRGGYNKKTTLNIPRILSESVGSKT